MSEEQNTSASNEATTPEAVLSAETISKLGEYFADILAPLKGLRETVDKSYSASIAYMDRVVLLAGGTLTLTFTALALISSRVQGAGRSASNPELIVYECWLLVLAIASGLLYSRVTISLRQTNDQTIVMSEMSLFAKVKLLSVNPKADITKVPEIKDDSANSRVKRLSVLTRMSSFVAHVSLTLAFICLARFIQENIGLILGAAPAVIKR